MKKITELNGLLPSVSTSKADHPVSLKTVLLNSIAVYRSPERSEPKDKLKVTKLGMIMLSAKDQVEIEDDYFELLKTIISSPTGYSDFIAGHALMRLEDCEKSPK